MEMLWALPVHDWNGLEEGQEEGPTECCLCLEAYQPDHRVRVLPCGHFFHQGCVDAWFQAKRFLPRTCPLCKRNPAPGAATQPAQELAGQLAAVAQQERW